MKVIIAGGRDFKGQQSDFEIIEKLHRQFVFTEIVSGRCGRKKGEKRKADGADGFGETFAKYYHLPIIPFYADWNDLSEPCIIRYRKDGKKYNKLAGPNRNDQMAQYADAVILFPGGKGTANMRHTAARYGLKILYDAGT